MPSRDTNVGAKRARETRAELGLAAPAPLGCVLTVVESRLGIPVVVAALADEIAGCCWREGGRALLWVNGTQAPARQRFTLAHELGHLRCRHDGTIPVETFVTLDGKATDSREVQANAFAAELLAPAAGVAAMVDGRAPGMEDVVRIAAAFGTSAVVALYRLNSLGLACRYEQLAAAIEAGEHEPVCERLDVAPTADLIAAIKPADLPRLSPSLDESALAGVARGRVSTEAAARAAGCDPAALASGAAAIGI